MNRIEQVEQATSVAAVSPSRAQYDAIVAFNKLNKLNSALPLPGYLRAEVLMEPGINAVEFKLRSDETANGQPIFPTEQRLNMNDAFYVTALAVMFQNAGAASADRFTALPQQAPFDDTFGADAPAMRAVYNGGKLSLIQNDRIYLRDCDLWRMQYVDTAQQGIVAGYTLNATDPQRGFLQSGDPMMRLNGPSNIEATLKLPQPFGGAGANDIYAIFYAVGWRVQNGGVARSI